MVVAGIVAIAVPLFFINMEKSSRNNVIGIDSGVLIAAREPAALTALSLERPRNTRQVLSTGEYGTVLR